MRKYAVPPTESKRRHARELAGCASGRASAGRVFATAGKAVLLGGAVVPEIGPATQVAPDESFRANQSRRLPEAARVRYPDAATGWTAAASSSEPRHTGLDQPR